jgi:TonB family protein
MDQEIDLSRFLHVEPDSQTRSGESGNAWHLTEKGGKRQSGSSLVPQGTGLLDSASSGTPGVGAAGGVDVAARGSDTMESQPFRFASFFSRLRWALEPAWQWRVGRLKNPGVLQKNTYLTAIEVQLSPDGRVLGRHLKSSSGWAQADLAALQAVSQMEQLQQLPPDLYREIEGRLDLRFHLKVKPEGFSWSKIEDPRFKDL